MLFVAMQLLNCCFVHAKLYVIEVVRAVLIRPTACYRVDENVRTDRKTPLTRFKDCLCVLRVKETNWVFNGTAIINTKVLARLWLLPASFHPVSPHTIPNPPFGLLTTNRCAYLFKKIVTFFSLPYYFVELSAR